MDHIFLVEDDLEIAKNLTLLLNSEGFSITHASSQKEAIPLIKKEKFQLALVDISLPDGNGFSVCTEIKQAQHIPVIFLTAYGDEASVVTGLNLGDDYVTKPFRPRELIARIQNSLRKYTPTSTAFEYDGLYVDAANGIVKMNGKEVYLSALEYRLLLVFINHPKSIMTRERLLDELWDASGEFVTNNTLTVYIKRLREKIESDPSNPKYILTVRGIGYRLGGSNVSQ